MRQVIISSSWTSPKVNILFPCWKAVVAIILRMLTVLRYARMCSFLFLTTMFPEVMPLVPFEYILI